MMKAGPLEPLCKKRLQTAVSGLLRFIKYSDKSCDGCVYMNNEPTRKKHPGFRRVRAIRHLEPFADYLRDPIERPQPIGEPGLLGAFSQKDLQLFDLYRA